MSFKINSWEEYQKNYQDSVENPEQFWGKIAESFEFQEKWNKVFSGDFKNCDFRWFEGAKLNITVNALDRHVKTQPNKVAVIFEPNQSDGVKQTITYQELYEQVCQMANLFKSWGVKKGDRVCTYMGMTPELMIAVLASARIGAIHSVVFGGFSAQSLMDRINDSECKILVTHDGVFRGAKEVPLKKIADEALENCPSIEKTLVVKRSMIYPEMKEGRDFYWHDLKDDFPKTCEPEIMDAEDPLFILYTSGSTGKPKGLMHTTAGYMIGTTYTFQNVFQIEQNSDAVYWCSADIGWITGHSYLTYAPLLSGITTMMFEGVPTYPNPARFWEAIEKHQVTHFYTAPTAIRALMACEHRWVEKYNLDSLKVIGTVGEPINVEAWQWYHKFVGQERCPIVDTWWQTETGSMMISPLAGITPLKPGHATFPLPGVQPVLMDENGKEIEGNDVSGNLCMKQSWPSQARTIYGDHDRFIQTYFSTYPNYYFTGDGCKRDVDGFYRITGRVDDVINVSGHRIGTAEVENAINEHEEVFESAVVGYPHEIKGQGIFAFIRAHHNNANLQKEIIDKVNTIIGPIAKPDQMIIVSDLPKTRSGKIMRRILRKLAAGEFESLGDTSTLLNPQIVEDIKTSVKKL
jgi:acetyl-CoA synthetase